MDKKFIIKFAFKNLMFHRLRAILTLLGVVIGFSAIVFLVSFAFGIERLVTNEVTKGDAFLLIDVGTGNSQIIDLTDATISSIKDFSGVKNVLGITSIAAKSKVGDKSMDISVYGTSADYLNKSGVRILKGTNLMGKNDEIIVNTAFLKFWSGGDNNVLGKRATFDVVIPKELVSKNDNAQIPNQTFQIAGIINDASSPKIYTDFDNLRKYSVASYSQFKVEVNNKDKVPEIRKQIENMGLKTQYVGDTVSQINQVFGIFRAILTVVGFIALLVAVLGMFNTMTISLLERIKEIALLKMLGMRRKDINQIFLAESLILGVFGGVLGLLLGIFAGRAVNFVLNHYAMSMGGQAVSVFYTPVSFIVLIVLVSIGVGLATGLYPARRAIKVKSLDALRFE